jgi:heme exporter protein B
VRPALAVLLHKEVLLRWRSPVRAVAIFAFGVTTLLLFSFGAGPAPQSLREHAAGFLWVALLLCSALTLAESFHDETEDGALEGILLLPTDPAAIYYGKALTNAALLALLGFLLTPVMLAMYDARIDRLPAFMGVVALGSIGIAVPGTLYAGMTAQARTRQTLLPVLLFPLLVPVLIASVRACTLLMTSDPMGQLASWVTLLAAFDVIYAALGGLLFEQVVED